MKTILDFLQTVGLFYLATTDGDRPHVRPLGFVMEHNGKLTFCTGNGKAMYRQMVANPKVELSCCDGDNTLRISGKAVFSTTAESQKKALDVMPELRGIYSVGDGVFETFYLDEATAVCTTMSGESKELSLSLT
ncbi:MAG: pyridoxamine 5'-phosphate oxidase family protein [Oscillospiraceae bacterium]|nr:pyridoxamine 5'-phosphate oxidase family protein [Oscillospiraceae bacterium]